MSSAIDWERATEEAIEHFNAAFRHRYRLPRVGIRHLQDANWLEDAWSDIPAMRAQGMEDPSCALIARAVKTR